MTSKVFCLMIVLSIFLVNIGKATAADEIKVASDCLDDDSKSKLVVFTALNLTYTLKAKQKTTRQLWKIDCSLKTSACSAAMITLDNIESGKKINVLDMILPDSLHIAAREENVFTIVFGPFITFTVDTAAGRVDYRESGPDVEARGVGYCR